MGGIFGGDAPEAPDPQAVAAAQTKSNKETAREQARLAMTGQTSDFGSVSYVKDPSSPSGYRAVQSLAPEEQALLAQQRDLRGNLGDTTNTALNNVSAAISGGPFDLTAARGREIADLQSTFLDPKFDNEKKALENDLLNRGIRPGSPQYENMMRQFGIQRSDAYNKMWLDAFTTANNAALTERNLPMQDYATLMGTMSPVSSNIPTASTPSPSVAPTNIADYIYKSYGAEAAQAQQQQSGLWNLIGTVGSAAVGLSDRRYKHRVEQVGRLPNGLAVYDFEYIGGDGSRYRGLMADEVALVHPHAVLDIGGVLHVDYSKAVL